MKAIVVRDTRGNKHGLLFAFGFMIVVMVGWWPLGIIPRSFAIGGSILTGLAVYAWVTERYTSTFKGDTGGSEEPVALRNALKSANTHRTAFEVLLDIQAGGGLKFHSRSHQGQRAGRNYRFHKCGLVRPSIVPDHGQFLQAYFWPIVMLRKLDSNERVFPAIVVFFSVVVAAAMADVIPAMADAIPATVGYLSWAVGFLLYFLAAFWEIGSQNNYSFKRWKLPKKALYVVQSVLLGPALLWIIMLVYNIFN